MGTITATVTDVNGQATTATADFQIADSHTIYVSPSGSDSNHGVSWDDALKTPDTAAEAANGTIIRLGPGVYQRTSPIRIVGKALYWRGSLMTADQIQANHNNVWFDTDNLTRYFDLVDCPGGSFSEIGFSNRHVTSEIIRIADSSNIAFEWVMVHPTNPVTNSLNLPAPVLHATGTNCSKIGFKYCDAHSSPLIVGDATVMHDWTLRSLRGQSDVSQSRPFVDLDGDVDGLNLWGTYLEKTNPAIRIRGRQSHVRIIPGGFERLDSPYYGLDIAGCVVGVGFGGGTNSHNGYVHITDSTGFVGVPSSRLSGSMHPGMN